MALGGSPGSKAMKQVSQQIFNFAIRAAGEGMKTRFCCFISVFFSSLDEVSDLEGVLKHSIFQGILIYQKKQLAFRFGV